MDSSISITFGKSIDDPDDPDAPISGEHFLRLGLDNDANEGKTSFVPGKTAYLQIHYSSSYTYESSGGTIKVSATKIPLKIEDECITFANADTGYLSYIPDGSVAYSWVGNDGGNPTFELNKVSLSNPAVAVLKCSYTTLGDRLSLKFSEIGEVVVYAALKNEESETSITVSFESDPEDPEDPEDPTPVAYELEVKNYCTDEILSGVTVYLDEVDIGQTNASGIIALGALIPGSYHTLKMARAGLINSELDKLNNDSFTVPV